MLLGSLVVGLLAWASWLVFGGVLWLLLLLRLHTCYLHSVWPCFGFALIVRSGPCVQVCGLCALLAWLVVGLLYCIVVSCGAYHCITLQVLYDVALY